LIRGEAVGHEPGFPGASRGQYQERAIEMAEDGCLLWVGIAHGIGVMLVGERSQITGIGVEFHGEDLWHDRKRVHQIKPGDVFEIILVPGHHRSLFFVT
jgi:hypothetical protein